MKERNPPNYKFLGGEAEKKFGSPYDFYETRPIESKSKAAKS